MIFSATGSIRLAERLQRRPTGTQASLRVQRIRPSSISIARSAYTVTLGANATNNGLRVEKDKVALALGTRTYALTSTSTSVPSVIVGATSGDAGTLTLSGTGAGGTLNSVNASIGDAPSSTGAVTVGTGATWNNSVDLYVGNSGAGTLTINSGGKVVAPTGGGSYIGYAAGSSGSGASVSGAGSTWTNDYLYVGNNAAGTLTTSSSGLVTSKVASVGYNATGGVTVSTARRSPTPMCCSLASTLQEQ